MCVCRRNKYDGEEEYFVVVRETGSKEKITEKESRQTEVAKAGHTAVYVDTLKTPKPPTRRLQCSFLNVAYA